MILINWIYLIAIMVAAAGIALLMWQWFKRRRDLALLHERIHQKSDCYRFLVDQRLQVKDTNFNELNETIRDVQPVVLGNVIHCQTAIDEGLCGTGINCDTCPIRVVIKNAFKLKRNFDHVEAVMHLYDADHKPTEMDVCVDGELVYAGKEPLFFVEVKH